VGGACQCEKKTQDHADAVYVQANEGLDLMRDMAAFFKRRMQIEEEYRYAGAHGAFVRAFLPPSAHTAKT